jgi:membrane-associated phospholipid phosphatase
MKPEENDKKEVVGNNPLPVPFWENGSAKLRVWLLIHVIAFFIGFGGGIYTISHRLFPSGHPSDTLIYIFALIYIATTTGIFISKQKKWILILYFVLTVLAILEMSELIGMIGGINIS